MASKANKELYSQFLLATFGRHSASWLGELLGRKPAHDTFTRWLKKTKLRPHIIWEHMQGFIQKKEGFLILDDTVLDKWYAKDIELVLYQYSGTHHRVVKGIGLTHLVWNSAYNPEEAEHITVDFRIYAPKYDGKTKNQHARDMLESAHERGFTPQVVLMDSWYSAAKTLELISSFGWTFLSALKGNRKLILPKDWNLKPRQYRRVADVATERGLICHLKDYGQVKIFKIVRKDGDIEYLATNDLTLTSPVVRSAYARRWKIEEEHRGLKQVTGLEYCQARSQRAQRNHILCSLLAFLALEKWRLETGVSWYEAKQQLIAYALSQYLKQPTIPLPNALA